MLRLALQSPARTQLYASYILKEALYQIPAYKIHRMSTHTSKRQKTADDAPYELIYWPSIPGRGEQIRLAFEASGTPYTDVGNASKDGIQSVLAAIDAKNTGDDYNPPPLAPPILKHGDLQLSQTSNILMYLAPKLALVPNLTDDPEGIYHVNALTLTALDGLSNETHDTHHPIASGDYYEDQKPEAKKKAADYIKARLPKFFGYFERVLTGSRSEGGEWLYGGQMTYADLVLFQCIDGNLFAFPKALEKMKKSGDYAKVFALHERVKGIEKIKAYLESERRLKYSQGIYRYYPELDLQE